MSRNEIADARKAFMEQVASILNSTIIDSDGQPVHNWVAIGGPDEDDWQYCSLWDNENGYHLECYWASDGRMTVGGAYPYSAITGITYGPRGQRGRRKNHAIGFQTSRGTKACAGEIKSRFLSKYITYFEDGKRRLEEDLEKMKRVQTAIEDLQGIYGGEAKLAHKNDNHWVERTEHNKGTLKFRDGTISAECTGLRVEITLVLATTPEIVAEVGKLLYPPREFDDA
jgi:hypothetical protein